MSLRPLVLSSNYSNRLIRENPSSPYSYLFISGPEDADMNGFFALETSVVPLKSYHGLFPKYLKNLYIYT